MSNLIVVMAVTAALEIMGYDIPARGALYLVFVLAAVIDLVRLLVFVFFKKS